MPSTFANEPSSWTDDYLLSQMHLGSRAFADPRRWEAILAEVRIRGLTQADLSSFRARAENKRSISSSIGVQLWLSGSLLAFGILATVGTYWLGHATATLFGSDRFYYGIGYGAAFAGLVGLGRGLALLWRHRRRV